MASRGGAIAAATIRAVKARKPIATRAALVLSPAAVLRVKELLNGRPDAIFINMPNTRLSKQKEEERQKLLQADTMPVEMEEVLAKAGNGQIDLVEQGDNETFNVQNSASDSEVESLSHRSSMFDSSNDSIVPNNSETPLASPAKSDSLTILKVGLKVGVKQRGCNGLSYTLDYCTEKGKMDEVVHQDGVTVIIDRKAQLSLLGTEMDFVKDKLTSEFVFNNPNIKGTCGCGESFNV